LLEQNRPDAVPVTRPNNSIMAIQGKNLQIPDGENKMIIIITTYSWVNVTQLLTLVDLV